jgi:hypothetical protein
MTVTASAKFRKKAFCPFLHRRTADLYDGRTRCPNSDLICHEQGLWGEQRLFLGLQTDRPDIGSTLEKTHDNRAILRDAFRKRRAA